MQSFGKFLLFQKSVIAPSKNAAQLIMNATRFSSTFHYNVKARVQHPAPHFEGMTWSGTEFKKISLNDYKGKYVVLFTYPLDFTFVCPTEIIEFNDLAPKFHENNCEVIAASIDSHFTHKEFANKPRKEGGLGGMQIPMFADLTKNLGRDYGCLTADDALHLRATYIIDDKGILRHMQFNDLPVGRNVPEVLRLVQAFQHNAKHGEVCPSKWAPGKQGIDGSHTSEKTLKYWKNEHAAGK
jgi:peroxiredoxin (alkyl hydroperoxide reductase subunit C)